MKVALGKIVLLWVAAAGTLWVHMLLGIPGDYLGQRYPLYAAFYTGLIVSPFSLAVESLVGTLPVLLLAAFGLWLRLQIVLIPVIWALWLFAASAVIWSFAIDFGTTWLPLEPLRALFLHPIHTPAAFAILALATWWALTPRPRG